MIAADSVVRLAPGVRMQQDAARGGWVLLGPERMLVLDDIAQLVISRLAGQSASELVAALAVEFDAPVEVIGADVLALLNTLADKGFVRYG